MVPGDPSFDFKLYRATKDKTSFDFTTDPLTPGLVLGPACICTEATDGLSKRLQHLDVEGHTLTEMATPGGPVQVCQAKLYSLLHRPADGEAPRDPRLKDACNATRLLVQHCAAEVERHLKGNVSGEQAICDEILRASTYSGIKSFRFAPGRGLRERVESDEPGWGMGWRRWVGRVKRGMRGRDQGAGKKGWGCFGAVDGVVEVGG